jgi:hypothetical protein
MYRGFVVLLLGISLPFQALGQITDDFGIWATVAYNKDVNKRIDLSFYQEVRMQEYGLVVGRTFSNFGIDYKAKRWLRFGGNYRFILDRRRDGSYGHRHRIMGDALLRGTKRRLIFTYRARLQWEVRTLNYDTEFAQIPEWDFRNTLKINYRINRMYRPYLTLDARFLIQNPREPYHMGFDRHRITVGVDIELNRTQVLGLFFLTGRHWNTLDGTRLFVIGTEFTFGSDRPLIGS